MIEKVKLDEIHQFVDLNKVRISTHASIDCIKQGYGWNKEFIIDCLKKGKIYEGKELYPPDIEDKKRLKRLYCLHKQNPLSSKLVLIGFSFSDDGIVIGHIAPCNKGSREGKIYYGL